MSSEIFVVPKLLAEFPKMPQLLRKSCLRAAARDEGLTVSQFIGELADDELKELVDLSLEAQKDSDLLIAIAIFCALLATSECLSVFDDEPLQPYVVRLSLIAQAEMLSRGGVLALDLSTLTMERFNIASVPKTSACADAEITIIRIPAPK